MKKYIGWSIVGWGITAVIWIIIDLIWHHEMFTHSLRATIYMQTFDGDFIIYWNRFWFWTTDALWSYWPFIALFFYPDKRVGNFPPKTSLKNPRLENFLRNTSHDVAKKQSQINLPWHQAKYRIQRYQRYGMSLWIWKTFWNPHKHNYNSHVRNVGFVWKV